MHKDKKDLSAMIGAALKKAEFLEPQADSERVDVYLPKPDRDPVDLEALRRDLMRRFSKTLAELAK